MNQDRHDTDPVDDEPFDVDTATRDAMHAIWVAGYNTGLIEGIQRGRDMAWPNPETR